MSLHTFDNAPKYEQRESGLLVPFRSLPGDHDHQGTLGEESVGFLRHMNRAGFSILHDLPNTPPDCYDCPYSSVSAFALDPQRIDLEKIVESGDLTRRQLDAYQYRMRSGDDGPHIQTVKETVLAQAYMNFSNSGQPERKLAFAAWQQAQSDWLDTYAAFSILSTLPQNADKRWQEWETGKDYSPQLVETLKSSYSQEYATIAYQQWIAEQQTLEYLEAADRLGIEVWGDVPFYVGTGEVWAHREIFHLDPDGNQLNQGGAPPSATSSIGQMWGNATYRVDPENDPEGTAKAVDWWTKRIQRSTRLHSGKVRLDHFIGFAEPYIIPNGAKDGQEGWRDKGIGDMLFTKLQGLLGEDLPLYPEDLGQMTHKTPEMRDRYGFLRTALAVRGLTKDLIAGNYQDSTNNPDNYAPNVAAFSGNHDSPTLIQALNTILLNHPDSYHHYAKTLQTQFPGRPLGDAPRPSELSQLEMERVVRSRSQIAIIAVWDYLGLDASAQYNKPGTISPSNWSWRMGTGDLTQFSARTAHWRELNKSSGRLEEPSDYDSVDSDDRYTQRVSA